MGNPLVSVVIPAYNHERFIGAAVDSVLTQSCDDLELIVIDDGSQDRTGEIVQGYTDRRLSYYFQENQDAFNTINRGLTLASGRFIAILNSDDVYTPDRLERMIAHHGETGAEVVFSDVVPISDDGEEFASPTFGWNLWHQKNRTYYRECRDLYTAFLKGNLMVTTSNLFMTAKAQKSVGLFCSFRYLHDYDYIFRLMLTYPDKVHYLEDEKLLYYRIHDGNTLGEAAVKGREQDKEVISRYMLARIPAELRHLVAAGSERLVELEQELNEVRSVLDPPNINRGVRPAARELLSNLEIWVKKKIT